jgi:hypothetical protein
VGKNVVPTRFGLIMVGNALLDLQVQVFVDGVPLRSMFDATTWEPYPSPQEVQNGLREQMGEFLDVKGVDHNVDNFVWDPSMWPVIGAGLYFAPPTALKSIVNLTKTL